MVGCGLGWRLPGWARTVLTAAAATAVAAAGIEDVEHVVIFMQENRPFDHYYGMLQGVRGFNDPAAPLLPNGDPVWKQPLSVQPATARFCGCSACDLVWLQKGSEVQSMFDTFSCPTLADYASGGKPPVPITQGELCSQVVKDLLTTDFENLRIADFLSPTSTCNASLVVTGLGTSSDVGDAAAYMLPFPLDFKTTAATCMPAPEMDYRCDIAMWNSGHCDAWNTARAPGFGMSHFNRSELPFYFALADAFTVGDQYFQSTYTATSPNREHLFSGSNGLSIGDGKFNLLDDSAPDGMEWETMGETLENANVSWKVYQGLDNFNDNAFAWFEPYKKARRSDPLWAKGMKHEVRWDQWDRCVAV